MTRVGWGVGAAVVVAIASGCSTQDIPIARIIDGGEEGGPAPPCYSDSDCEQLPGTFCSKTSCQDSAQGYCQGPPPTCVIEFSPECGCDGMTYYHRCLRLRAHKNLMHAGQCIGGCDGGCSNGICGFVPSPPDFVTPGAPVSPCGLPYQYFEMLESCWDVPDACPPDASNPLVDCRATAQCVDRCNAARRGGIYLPSQQCLQQP